MFSYDVRNDVIDIKVAAQIGEGSNLVKFGSFLPVSMTSDPPGGALRLRGSILPSAALYLSLILLLLEIFAHYKV